MANTNKPQGFELSQSEGKEYRTRAYRKATGDVIAIGDPVSIAAGGDVELFDNGDTSGLLGVSLEYKAGTDTSDILICDDPEAVYEVMVLGNFALADIFLNADVNAGTVSNKRSGAALTGLAAGATLPFKIIGLAAREGNEVGSFARVLVKPNQHAFRAGVAGI
jgi:hypothetical protein